MTSSFKCLIILRKRINFDRKLWFSTLFVILIMLRANLSSSGNFNKFLINSRILSEILKQILTNISTIYIFPSKIFQFTWNTTYILIIALGYPIIIKFFCMVTHDIFAWGDPPWKPCSRNIVNSNVFH